MPCYLVPSRRPSRSSVLVATLYFSPLPLFIYLFVFPFFILSIHRSFLFCLPFLLSFLLLSFPSLLFLHPFFLSFDFFALFPLYFHHFLFFFLPSFLPVLFLLLSFLFFSFLFLFFLSFLFFIYMDGFWSSIPHHNAQFLTWLGWDG